MIYGARKKQEFFVDINNPESLKALKDAIYDDRYYTREEFRDISIKGTFDSDIICNPCSNKWINYPTCCSIAQAVASERPFAIICPKCGINYMEFIKD